MSDIVLRVEDLSKQYRIGGSREAYKTLRETLTDVIVSPFRRASKLLGGRGGRAAQLGETIWALKDVSFEIKRGEVVGIIGHNGAGKSTLLKILSRITEPTEGYAEIYGRVGSLLEVGTGFHAELTGRENVYLNGAILGMKKAEIARKFDEIVAFAEIEKFIDTPVKHYSSGMYLRLAFAVAAHLEPEIMIVDEVLAVGDAHFFSKCTDKIRTLNAQGMTIVLVTHDMWFVQTLCSRVICLEKGHIVAEGRPREVTGAYLNMIKKSQDQEDNETAELLKSEAAKILHFQVSPQGEWATEKEALPDSGITVAMAFKVNHFSKVKFLVRVTTPDGLPYFTVYSRLIDTPQSGRVECKATIPHLMLMPGEYFLWGSICSHKGEQQILAEGNAPLFVKGNEETASKYSLFFNKAQWHICNSSESS